jgi:AP-2 complex subunit sigma-1
VDANDNELAYLEAIHLFVEILGGRRIYISATGYHSLAGIDPDSFFDNVCELDLVFNFYKVRFLSYSCTILTGDSQVYAILDEIFLAGEIEETSKDVVLSRLEELEKLE